MSALAIAVPPVKYRRPGVGDNQGAVQAAQARLRAERLVPGTIAAGRGGNAMPVGGGRYAQAFTPLAGAPLITLLEREKGQCAWSHDGPKSVLFCGLATAATGDRHARCYCAAHQAMRGAV